MTARSPARGAGPSFVGWLVAAIPVAATVGTFGELSIQALVAVTLAGLVVLLVGLRRAAGSAAPSVGPAGLLWIGWLVLVSLWELFLFLRNARYPTLSDLADPVLAHPAVRGTAVLVWAAAGWWLVRRPALPRATP